MSSWFSTSTFAKNYDFRTVRNRYRQIQSFVQICAEKTNALHHCQNIESMTYEQFLPEVIEITEQDYIKVITSTLSGPKVFLERKPSVEKCTDFSVTFPGRC